MVAKFTQKQLDAINRRSQATAVSPAKPTGAAKKGKRQSSGTETALVRSCLDLLAIADIMAWRNNTTGVFDPSKKVFRTFTGRKGVSDILGVAPDGRLLAVECKVGKNALSLDQQQFIDDVRSRGGVALVVYSVEELKTALLLEYPQHMRNRIVVS